MDSMENHKQPQFSGQSWRIVGGKRIYFRSKWEANYGRYLEWRKENKEILDWFHEPFTFWFQGIRRGCVSYLPDFKIIENDQSYYWAEVKGWMDARSKTKIKRFKKYFPKEKLIIIGEDWFKKNRLNMSALIKEWE